MNILSLGDLNKKYESKIKSPLQQENNNEKQIIAPVKKHKLLKGGFLGLGLLSLASTVTPQIINIQPAHAVEVNEPEIQLPKLSAKILQTVNAQPTQNLDFSQDDALTSFKGFYSKDSKSLVYKGVWKKSILSPEDAAKYLKDGYKIHVKNSSGDLDEVVNLNDLQVLDSIRGTRIKPVISEVQAKALLSLEKGIDSGDGIFTTGRGLFKTSYKISAFQAYNLFKNKKEIELNIKLGSDNDNLVSNLDDIALLHVLQGGGANEGLLPEELHHALLSYNNVNIDSTPGTSYDLYKHLQKGGSLLISGGGKQNRINSFDDLKKLDILYTGGKNTILPQDQLDTLKYLSDSFSSREIGVYANGTKLNSYDVLKLLQQGRQVDFTFAGGDFDERLSIPVNNFNDLLETKAKFENQKEYDKYQYGQEEFKNKLAPFINKLFPLLIEQSQMIPNNLKEAENNITKSSVVMGTVTKILKDTENNTEWVRDNGISNIKTALEKAQNATEKTGESASRMALMLSLSNKVTKKAQDKMGDIQESLTHLLNKLTPSDSPHNPRPYPGSGNLKDEINNEIDGNNSIYSKANGKIKDAIRNAKRFQSTTDSLIGNIVTIYNAVDSVDSNMKDAESYLNNAVTDTSNSREHLTDTKNNINNSIKANQSAETAFSQQDSNVKNSLSNAKSAYGKIKIKENSTLSKDDTDNVIQEIMSARNEIKNRDFHRNTIMNNINNMDSSVGRANGALNNIESHIGSATKQASAATNSIEWSAVSASNSASVNLSYTGDHIKEMKESLASAKEDISDRSLKQELDSIERAIRDVRDLMSEVSGYLTITAVDMTILAETVDKVYTALDAANNAVASNKSIFAKTGNAVSQASNVAQESKNKAAASVNLLNNAENFVVTLPSLVENAGNAKNGFKVLTDINNTMLAPVKASLHKLNTSSTGELVTVTAKGLKLINNMETRQPRPDRWTPLQPRVSQ